MHPILIASAVALLIPALPAVSRAASPHPCATVSDDTQRLACYDRTFGTPADPKLLPEPGTRGADELPGKFTAVISKIEWRNGVFVATLDNGQVWVQSERDSRVQLAARDTVTLRRASLGSWLLTGEQGIAARVRRQR